MRQAVVNRSQGGLRTLFTLVALAVSATLLTPEAVQAQEEDSKWAVGLQWTYPAYGISAKYDWSDKLRVQAIVATGALNNISARGNWLLKSQEKYDWFAYGSVSFWSWDRCCGQPDESSIGFGGGAGIELDWAAIFDDDDFPALFSTIELGIGAAPGFSDYDFTVISFGGSLHYHF